MASQSYNAQDSVLTTMSKIPGFLAQLAGLVAGKVAATFMLVSFFKQEVLNLLTFEGRRAVLYGRNIEQPGDFTIKANGSTASKENGINGLNGYHGQKTPKKSDGQNYERSLESIQEVAAKFVSTPAKLAPPRPSSPQPITTNGYSKLPKLNQQDSIKHAELKDLPELFSSFSSPPVSKAPSRNTSPARTRTRNGDGSMTPTSVAGETLPRPFLESNNFLDTGIRAFTSPPPVRPNLTSEAADNERKALQAYIPARAVNGSAHDKLGASPVDGPFAWLRSKRPGKSKRR